MTTPVRYMLDTNIFSNLVNGRMCAADLPSDGQLCGTPVQMAELDKTRDLSQREQSLCLFQKLVVEEKANMAPAFLFGVEGAGFGQGEWRHDAAAWYAIKNDLDEEWECRPNRKKRLSRKENNIRDAAIAEAALHNGCVLITGDRALAAVATRHGIKVIFVNMVKRN